MRILNWLGRRVKIIPNTISEMRFRKMYREPYKPLGRFS